MIVISRGKAIKQRKEFKLKHIITPNVYNANYFLCVGDRVVRSISLKREGNGDLPAKEYGNAFGGFPFITIC